MRKYNDLNVGDELNRKNFTHRVLNYRKLTFWIIGFALLLSIGIIYFIMSQLGKDYRILDISSGSEHVDVEYRYVGSYWNGEYSYIDVEWTNHSDRAIGYGEGFSLYKDGKPVSMKDNYGFNDVLYILQPGKSVTLRHSMIVYNINYARSGLYRIENSFQFDGDNYMTDPHYMVYVEFEVGK